MLIRKIEEDFRITTVHLNHRLLLGWSLTDFIFIFLLQITILF